MKETLSKIKSYSKFILIAMILAKILSTILFVPFSSHNVINYFIPFFNFSFFYTAAQGYGIESDYEAIKGIIVLFFSITGWPATIILTLAMTKRVWVPVVSVVLMSVINICCCIESILSHNINGVIIKSADTLYPHKVINIIYCSVILLLSVVYLITHKSTFDKNLDY